MRTNNQKRVVAGSEVTLFIMTKNGFKKVAGQEYTEVLREAELLEVGTKENCGRSVYIPISIDYIVNCRGFYVANDTAFEALEESFDNLTNVEVKVEVGNLYCYKGAMTVEEIPLTFDNKEAEMEIKLVGALTKRKMGE